MYLIDTNVVSESRKRGRANSGVIDFFEVLNPFSAEPSSA
jgi:hypothetical protein